jgi:hypothetical protein
MHPIVAYDLAKLKIEESHRQAALDRRYRMAIEANQDAQGIRMPEPRRTTTVRARLAGVLTFAGLIR